MDAAQPVARHRVELLFQRGLSERAEVDAQLHQMSIRLLFDGQRLRPPCRPCRAVWTTISAGRGSGRRAESRAVSSVGKSAATLPSDSAAVSTYPPSTRSSFASPGTVCAARWGRKSVTNSTVFAFSGRGRRQVPFAELDPRPRIRVVLVGLRERKPRRREERDRAGDVADAQLDVARRRRPQTCRSRAASIRTWTAARASRRSKTITSSRLDEEDRPGEAVQQPAVVAVVGSASDRPRPPRRPRRRSIGRGLEGRRCGPAQAAEWESWPWPSTVMLLTERVLHIQLRWWSLP